MPALVPTDHTATIIWLGIVPVDSGLRAVGRDVIAVGWDGPEGESHGGLTRPSCSRVTSQHPKGTEIANARQFSIVSAEELSQIATDMGMEAINPQWLGATLVIQGIPDFTFVPPSSRIQAGDGTTLVVDMENRPCQLPGYEIEKDHPGSGKAFKAAAKDRRGVTAWVERPGTLKLGDTLRLHCPSQRAWSDL